MTKHITQATRLTVLKHLAKGKSPDVVAAATKLDRHEVIDIGSHHGYPDPARLAKAVDIITSKMAQDALAQLPPGTNSTAPATTRTVSRSIATAPVPASPLPPPPQPPQPAVSSGGPAPAPGVEDTPVALTDSDEIRATLNAGRQSQSRRIQKLADRILADVGRLKDQLQQERATAAERDALERRKARLEQQLASVNAQLRGGRSPKTVQTPTASSSTGDEPSAKEIRVWAAGRGIECPTTGRVPLAVRAAYAAAHQGKAA